MVASLVLSHRQAILHPVTGRCEATPMWLSPRNQLKPSLMVYDLFAPLSNPDFFSSISISPGISLTTFLHLNCHSLGFPGTSLVKDTIDILIQNMHHGTACCEMALSTFENLCVYIYSVMFLKCVRMTTNSVQRSMTTQKVMRSKGLWEKYAHLNATYHLSSVLHSLYY